MPWSQYAMCSYSIRQLAKMRDIPINSGNITYLCHDILVGISVEWSRQQNFSQNDLHDWLDCKRNIPLVSMWWMKLDSPLASSEKALRIGKCCNSWIFLRFTQSGHCDHNWNIAFSIVKSDDCSKHLNNDFGKREELKEKPGCKSMCSNTRLKTYASTAVKMNRHVDVFVIT